MEPPATTAGIYCQACGYDLRASGEAKRCPECGRAFSPDDPKTFRRRPFAAPWKRALARWAKRGAILLLVLAILLAGVWGWLYWGWKQEQPVLAGRDYSWIIVGGDAGRWLFLRIPGRFVLLRAFWVTLPQTATDADVLQLRKLPELEELIVQGPITDAGMAHLRKCPRLRVLWIQTGSRVTDAGFAALRDLPRLERLDMEEASISDAGLIALERLTELQRLSLDRAPLTDAGLVHLVPLGKLQELSLGDTRVTDAGLVHLLPLGELRHLCLQNTQVTDAGLVQVEKLGALEALNLSGTQITDVGLVSLARLRTLKYLNLMGTRGTPAGVARLKAALPGCNIAGP